MVDELQQLLTELEEFGRVNDSSTSDRSRSMLNITHDTGEFFSVLVRAMQAQRILEVGTSNGYSTLWLASAARAVGGSVTTVEKSDYKVELAARNFARSGLDSVITQIHSDAGPVIIGMEAAAFDLIFLDSERGEYPGWWHDIKRILHPGGLLLVDNATSHAQQLAPFFALVKSDLEFMTSLVPVGNGEFLATKARRN
jgi:predicted O-methyltransferase YrrM